MNHEDIIRLARQLMEERGGARMDEEHDLITYSIQLAAIVAAAERAACAEHYLGIMRNAVTSAVEAEREACAKIAETPQGEYEVVVACGTEPAPHRISSYLNWQDIAKTIRARSQQ